MANNDFVPPGLSANVLETRRHTTAYLDAGPKDGPLIIFTHGWPELSLSWRHQLQFFAAMGLHAVAPDMRGYGRSSIYARHQEYAQALIIEDMLELIDSLGQERAVWVGHDWGSPVAWNMASHHPDRCVAVASLCVPYASIERGLDEVIQLVDRNLYPEADFPAGQWEYMRYYEENFEAATKPMDANAHNMVQLIFRKADPAGFGQVSGTALVRRNGGWFGGTGEAPEVPRDDDVISEQELKVYGDSLKRNGFFGPNSWYMNHQANAEYFKTAVNGGRLELPALFIAAQYDSTCESITSRLPEPMRKYCTNLTEAVVYSGHWMAQEKPADVNRELVSWLAREVPGFLKPARI